MKGLLEKTLRDGYRHFKLKVGGNLEEDKRRLAIAREVIGYDRGNVLMVDANQVRLSWRDIHHIWMVKWYKRRSGPFPKPSQT